MNVFKFEGESENKEKKMSFVATVPWILSNTVHAIKILFPMK